MNIIPSEPLSRQNKLLLNHKLVCKLLCLLDTQHLLDTQKFELIIPSDPLFFWEVALSLGMATKILKYTAGLPAAPPTPPASIS